jgi:hypothetical protein
MAAVAMLALAVPKDGIAPELSAAARAAQELDFAAYWRMPTLPPVLAETPALRKRVANEKPARMIDDAVRRRALDAVGRAVALESPPV